MTFIKTQCNELIGWPFGHSNDRLQTVTDSYRKESFRFVGSGLFEYLSGLHLSASTCLSVWLNFTDFWCFSIYCAPDCIREHLYLSFHRVSFDVNTFANVVTVAFYWEEVALKWPGSLTAYCLVTTRLHCGHNAIMEGIWYVWYMNVKCFLTYLIIAEANE